LELKLPGMERAYMDILSGGAPLGIEASTHFNKLESTFNLAGWSPNVQKMLGLIEPTPNLPYQTFTAYGLVRNKRSNTASQAKAIMWGELSRMNPTAFRKGDIFHHEYAIRSIVHYELYIAGEGVAGDVQDEIIYWDHFASEFRIGGKDINRDYVMMLQIPGIAQLTPEQSKN
jgi:phage tail tube protein FII